MPNRLAAETSPYLLQHKDNPVDWYPWGPQALASAKLQDKPILLSIGYSACHWCHVMAHESFEDPQIAAQMNRLFVNVKVDREERPDIDSIYMAAVQAMTGSGGWPLTVFLTPEGRPFYGGTYFPPEDRRGHAGFPRVLEAVAEAFRTKRGEILTQSSNVIGAIRQQSAPRASEGPLDRDLVTRAFLAIMANADEVEGGFGVQPKFPQPATFEFLLRYWYATRSAPALDFVSTTLTKMANGGIYDQVGGGFHRYSTDSVWLVPHFEKMLYDNAQLATLYLHGWQITREPLFKRVIEETFAYILTEMTDASGGFYSSDDADSEGEEGKFFVWLDRELVEALGPELARIASAYWDITREGNFEGRNILHVTKTHEEVASELGVTVHGVAAAIDKARPLLRAHRARRIPPATDTKVLTSWNALMLSALAECGAVLGVPAWTEAARKNATFLLGEMTTSGELQRSWKDGVAKQPAFLEDYANLAGALVTLYEATLEPRWLTEAQNLADKMIAMFWEPSELVYYDTSPAHEQLVVRPRDLFDNASPCGSSAAALALLRLAELTGVKSYEETALSAIASAAEVIAAAPQGTATWLAALDFYTLPRIDIVLSGPPEDPAAAVLAIIARAPYMPDRVMASVDPTASGNTRLASALTEGRGLVNGKPAAYVCENYVCDLPVTSAIELDDRLYLRHR